MSVDILTVIRDSIKKAYTDEEGSTHFKVGRSAYSIVKLHQSLRDEHGFPVYHVEDARKWAPWVADADTFDEAVKIIEGLLTARR